MQRQAEMPVAKVGDLEIDNLRHRVTRAGEELKLTPKEFDLLFFLALHCGKIVTHRQILTAVWGPAHIEDTQYLRVHIGRLRHKVESDPNDPRIIVTKPGSRIPDRGRVKASTEAGPCRRFLWVLYARAH
jgi:two-component system KDP operon response regulator KdpE